MVACRRQLEYIDERRDRGIRSPHRHADPFRLFVGFEHPLPPPNSPLWDRLVIAPCDRYSLNRCFPVARSPVAFGREEVVIVSVVLHVVLQLQSLSTLTFPPPLLKLPMGAVCALLYLNHTCSVRPGQGSAPPTLVSTLSLTALVASGRPNSVTVFFPAARCQFP